MCLIMNAVFAALGVLDVLAAYLLFNPFSEAAVLYLMMYVLAKGGFFLLTSVASKAANPFFLALCAVDVLTGIALGAVSLGYVGVMVAGIVFAAQGRAWRVPLIGQYADRLPF